jgi:replicative DNA helicase
MTLKEKERAVLNLYADNENLFETCHHLIFEELWSTNFNKVKYKIIKHNHDKGRKSDVYLLSNMLIKSGCNKKEIGLEVSEPNYAIAKNVSEYVNDIFDEYTKRKMLPILHSVHSELSNEITDVNSSIEDLKSIVSDIESIKNNLSVERHVEDIFDEAFEELMEAQNSKSETIGHSYGIKDLNKITSGAKQEVIVVGARPGMGKTSLIINITKHIAVDKGEPLIIFSLEMPAKQLMKNIWANCLEINSWQIRSGNVSDEDLIRIKKLRDKIKRNLVIDDTPGITWQYMRTKIRKVRKQLGIPLSTLMTVMIDYLQLMKNTKEETVGKSKEEQVGDRCNGLLETSKTENCCMIELSQLSRDVEKRNPPYPLMSDLKDSGAIEANAVQIWLLYRADYYNSDATDPKTGMDLRGLCEINVAKNRYGSTGKVYVRFEGKYSAFKDFDINEVNGLVTGSSNGDEF